MLAILIMLLAQKTLLQDKPIPNVSAVSTTKIGVYWDQNCTKTVTSIKWGVLSPGETKNITVYVRNEDNTTIILKVNTTNWNPEKAPEFLNFSYYPINLEIEIQKTAKITLTLHVHQNTSTIKQFSFDIIFEGKTQTYLPTDLNKDGIVNMLDIMIVASAYGSRPGDPNWNETADITKDGIVNMRDVILVVSDYGKAS